MSSIREWLSSIENGRFDKAHAEKFAENFSTVDDLREVAREIGADAMLKELGVSALTDKVKLKKAVEELLVVESTPVQTTPHPPTLAPMHLTLGPLAPDERVDKMAASDDDDHDAFLECDTPTGQVEWTEASELATAADAINEALMANGDRYSCQTVTLSADNGYETQLLAVVANTERAALQHADKQWASVRLQSTFIPAAQAEALAPSIAATSINLGRLEYKPGYQPQHTTLIQVSPVRVRGVIPSVAEAIAAVEEMERTADEEQLRAFVCAAMAERAAVPVS